MQRRNGRVLPAVLAGSGVTVSALLFGAYVWVQSGDILSLDESQYTILQQTNTLQIYCLDVNQASSTLIITPSRNHAILVDAGNTADGKKAVLPMLALCEEINGRKPPAIDLMVITHYDSDHIGGADEVLLNYPVRELLDHGDHAHWKEEKGSTALKDYIAAAASAETNYPAPLDFDRTIDGVRVQCLAGNGKTRFDPPGSSYEPDPGDDNPNSVGLLISWQGFDLYVAGDQTGDTEERMVGHGVPDLPDLNVDVYHMNHHGSATHGSSSTNFLAMLSPEVAIASNGKHKTFGHPHFAPVSFLTNMGTHVYLMNKNPHSEVTLAEKWVSDDSPGGRDGTIVVSVNSADDEYCVLMPGLDVAEGSYPIER